MYARLLPTPQGSAFLFGPRGTGKSTWLRERFPRAVGYDLLDTGEALRLAKEPRMLYRELSALPANAWVVIDEVQKVPALLDEVHRLIETRRLRFVLSGSSERKLRRGGVNLLAGRAITAVMLPLTSAELDFAAAPSQLLRYGSLPMAVDAEDPRPYLRSYAETYLVQEVQAEALTRNVGAFARFLEVAARQNGQATNATAIARAVGTRRETVRSHFEILVDTLLGYWLPAWKLKVRQQAGGAQQVLLLRCRRRPGAERPPALSAHQRGTGPAGRNLPAARAARLSGLHGASTIGCTSGAPTTARRWTCCAKPQTASWPSRSSPPRTGRSASTAACAGYASIWRTRSCYGVYFGERAALWDDVYVLPAMDFLKRLWDGDVIR